MIKIRASAADRIFGCNYSSIKPEMLVDTSGPWSNFGNAGHEIMGQIVKHDLTYMPDLSKAIDEYKVEDEKALRIALYRGLKEYKEVIRPSVDLETLVSEERMERKLNDKYLLTGHTDFAALMTDHSALFASDWKFGNVTDHWNQLKSYAFLLFQQFPGVDRVLLGAYFFRNNERSVKEFTRDHIENEWRHQFIEALEGETLRPGYDNCVYCPVITCSARDTLARSTMTALATIDEDQSTAVAMADKYQDVQLVKKFIDKYYDHLKDHIKMTGEEIPLSNGKVLGLIQGHRGTLYLWEALPLLKDYFDMDNDELIEHLKSCLTIKKTDLLDIVGRSAGYKMIGKEKKRITEEMESAGAIRIKTFDKLTLKKGDSNG